MPVNQVTFTTSCFMKLSYRLTFFVFLPLLIGGLIYLFFRPQSLLLYKLFPFTQIPKTFLNETAPLLLPRLRIHLPDWVVFSLPDALWSFSGSHYLKSIKASQKVCIWFFPAIGAGAEILQLTSWFPGTFDLLDLFFIGLFMIFFYFQHAYFSPKFTHSLWHQFKN